MDSRTARNEGEHEANAPDEKRNVGRVGRWGSLAAGGLLGAFGLARAIRSRRPRGILLALGGALLARRGLTGHCGVYESLGIDTSEKGVPGAILPRTVKLARSITIGASKDEIRAFLEKPEHLSTLIPGVESVRPDGEHRLVVVTAGGIEVPVDIEREDPDTLLFWASAHGIDIEDGKIELGAAPGDRGTEVSVRLSIDLPGGPIAAVLGRVLRDVPDVAFLGEVLYRLRAMLVAGEVPVSDDTSARHATGLAARRTAQEALRS